MGVAGRLSRTVSPFRAEQGTSLETPWQACEGSGSQSHLVLISVCLDGDIFSIVAISAPALSFKPNGERKGSRFLKAITLGMYDIGTLLNLKYSSEPN